MLMLLRFEGWALYGSRGRGCGVEVNREVSMAVPDHPRSTCIARSFISHSRHDERSVDGASPILYVKLSRANHPDPS